MPLNTNQTAMNPGWPPTRAPRKSTRSAMPTYAPWVLKADGVVVRRNIPSDRNYQPRDPVHGPVGQRRNGNEHRRLKPKTINNGQAWQDRLYNCADRCNREYHHGPVDYAEPTFTIKVVYWSADHRRSKVVLPPDASSSAGFASPPSRSWVPATVNDTIPGPCRPGRAFLDPNCPPPKPH